MTSDDRNVTLTSDPLQWRARTCIRRAAQGLRYDKQNHLLMHAAGANTGGQIGSVVAAAVMLSVLKGMGLI